MKNNSPNKQTEQAEAEAAASKKAQRRTPDQRVDDGMRRQSILKRDKHQRKKIASE